MKITILQRDDDITHVALVGRLDTAGAEEISDEFAEATATRERPTIVDLSEIDFMASRGISLLFASSKRLMKHGHRLVLLSPQELVESGLRTCKADKVMPIVHDLNEAVQILHGAAGPSESARRRLATSDDVTSAERPEPVSAAPVASEGELKLAIKNELTELEGLNTALAQFLDLHGVPHRATYAVNLAIDELVVNVMRYAYIDDDTHLIDIELAIEGDQVILQIVDDGRPFDPRSGPSLDLNAEEREVGELGLLLVLDMVDVLKYQRIDEKNWVEVRVHLFAEDENRDLSETRHESSDVNED